jgi:integrase
MSGIMAAAVRDQRIGRNPCVGLTLPRLPEPRQRFLTLDELHRLAAEAGEYRVMVLVLGLCGLRIGECLALRVRSVDALRRRLRVSESVSEVGGKLIWSTPKITSRVTCRCPRTVAELVVEKTAGKGPGGLAVHQSGG